MTNMDKAPLLKGQAPLLKGQAPLLKGLLSYNGENNAIFHMPGHKQDPHDKLSSLLGNVLKLDVTEVPGTDNLHYPEEILRESMELLTKAMGSAESRYLVNGSTGGILAMVMGCFRPGERVLVQRDCHQSVYNAISLSGIVPVFISPAMNEEFGILTALEADTVVRAIAENDGLKGLILTSPSYFGISPDLHGISGICRRNGLKLIIDEAHGSHFYFGDELPMTAMDSGATASVCSFHKTLPALTQGSVINLGKGASEEDKDRIRHYLRVFQTSSPSYVLMASLEAARLIMETEGRELLKGVKTMVDGFSESIRDIHEVRLLKNEDLKGLQKDYTRLVLNTPLSGNVLSEILRRDYGIQAEMAMGKSIVFLGSCFDDESMYRRLSDAMNDLNLKGMFSVSMSVPESSVVSVLPSPVMAIPERDALFESWEQVPFELAAGRICAERITPYPPGVPVLMTGELVSREVVELLASLEASGSNILKSRSDRNGTIAVIRE